MSACVICANVPAGTPVAALAVLATIELLRPNGRLFLSPGVVPPPLVSPWHSRHVLVAGAAPCREIDLLQVVTVVVASLAWQPRQSLPTTRVEPWFIHWPPLVAVAPAVSVYVMVLWVG